jgi:putative Ca2+/H+ antiporter (TMEM165/GDT1 family)
MEKLDFRKIFGWMCWISLVIVAGWVGLLFLDFIRVNSRNIAEFALFLMIGLFNFAVDSLMKENPEQMKRYFVEWLIASGFFIFLGYTIYVWLP